MGLDVKLCQFKDVNTDAILELSRYDDLWTVMPKAEKGSFQDVVRKAQELGLSEATPKESLFGGTEISFPSKRHPQLPVGDWYSFSITFELMQRFIGKDIYFVFPEAKGDPKFFRPDWAESKERLENILPVFRKLEKEDIEDFHKQFVMPHVPKHLLEKIKPSQLAPAPEILAKQIAQVEV